MWPEWKCVIVRTVLKIQLNFLYNFCSIFHEESNELGLISIRWFWFFYIENILFIVTKFDQEWKCVIVRKVLKIQLKFLYNFWSIFHQESNKLGLIAIWWVWFFYIVKYSIYSNRMWKFVIVRTVLKIQLKSLCCFCSMGWN